MGVVQDLAPDALDVHIDEVGTGVVVVVPDVFAELGAVEDASGRPHEAGEEGELAGGERDRLCTSADVAGEEVDVEFTGGEQAGLVAGAASQDGVEPGDEFVGVEGLGEVIVSAEIQAFDAFVEGGAGGQEEDGNGIPEFAELAEDAEAVAARQHDVEHEGIVGMGRGEREGVGAIVAGIDDEAGGLECLADEGRDLPIVFRHEDLHGLEASDGVLPRVAVNHDKTVMRTVGEAS